MARPVGAESILEHRLNAESGLPPGAVLALVQDGSGEIWVAQEDVLLRYDGRRFTSVPLPAESPSPAQLESSSLDGLVVRSNNGYVWQRRADGFAPLPGPDARPLQGVRSLRYDSRGRLWALQAERLWLRDEDRRWALVPPERYAAEHLLSLWPLSEGMGVVSDGGSWWLDSVRDSRRLMSSAGLAAVTGGVGDSSLWVVAAEGHGLWHGGPAAGWTVMQRPEGRFADLALRGQRLWLSLDRGLASLSLEGDERWIGGSSGGPLRVDAEQALWLGDERGLAMLAEPETRHWSEADGLPPGPVEALQANGTELWIATRGGLARFEGLQPEGGPAELLPARGRVCSDAQNHRWTVQDGVLRRDGGDIARSSDDANVGSRGLLGCALAADGRLWLAGESGLWRVSIAGRAEAVLPRLLLAGRPGIDQVWTDEAGGLWLSAGNAVCNFQPAREAAPSPRNCGLLPARGGVRAVAPLSAGRWALATGNGVLLFEGFASLEPAKPPLVYGSGSLQAVAAAADGGIWVAAASGVTGGVERLLPCGDCTGGWRVAESLSGWQGLSGTSVAALAELPDGSLWVAGSRGLFQLPRAARGDSPAPPSLRLAAVRVDGQPQPIADGLTLSPDQRELVLEFRVPSYRDRSRLQLRWRLNGQEWSLAGSDTLLRFYGLAAGHYRLEAQASLDGQHWSEPAQALAFRSLPPWYRRPWALAGFVLAGLALVVLIYRLRVSQLLRLERQRVQIAMDLHDEMGSTLGSIGMLASVAARGDIAETERQRLAAEIESSTALLGGGLRTLVWSMREGRADLRDLGSQLADSARRLFPRDEPQLRFELAPLPPAGGLAASVHRHVLMIALEALHNAARHAHARWLDVSLVPVAATGLWRLRIRDDGRGFDSRLAAAGAGLESMRRRARLIDARLSVDSQPAAGCSITLEFLPFGAPRYRRRPHRMIMRWWHGPGGRKLARCLRPLSPRP